MEDVRSVSGGQMGMDKGLRLVTHGVDRVRFGDQECRGQPESDSCPKSTHPQKKNSRACLIHPQGNSKSSTETRHPCHLCDQSKSVKQSSWGSLTSAF